MLPSDFGLFNLNFSVLLLLLTLGGVQAVCPYCFGNFASCTYDNDQKCPAVEVPATNALVVAAGGDLTAEPVKRPAVSSLHLSRLPGYRPPPSGYSPFRPTVGSDPARLSPSSSIIYVASLRR